MANKFVICTLRNAADTINGIPFVAHAEGKVSAEALPEAVAERFASIDGYKLADSKDSEKPAPKPTQKPAKPSGEPKAAAKADAKDNTAPAADAAAE